MCSLNLGGSISSGIVGKLIFMEQWRSYHIYLRNSSRFRWRKFFQVYLLSHFPSLIENMFLFVQDLERETCKLNIAIQHRECCQDAEEEKKWNLPGWLWNGVIEKVSLPWEQRDIKAKARAYSTPRRSENTWHDLWTTRISLKLGGQTWEV